VGDFPVAITFPKLHRDGKDLKLVWVSLFYFLIKWVAESFS